MAAVGILLREDGRADQPAQAGERRSRHREHRDADHRADGADELLDQGLAGLGGHPHLEGRIAGELGHELADRHVLRLAEDEVQRQTDEQVEQDHHDPGQQPDQGALTEPHRAPRALGVDRGRDAAPQDHPEAAETVAHGDERDHRQQAADHAAEYDPFGLRVHVTPSAPSTVSRKDISDDEYKEFYKHISHDFQDPLVWSHNKVEGKLDYTSLIYIPSVAPFDLWQREATRGLKLYVQRVYIMDEADQFLPLYLRFVKGALDSNDLSLNISRELLQKDAAVESMRIALTKRVLDMLEKMSKKNKEDYQKFWQQFGQVMKEGPAEDFANRDKVSKLLRFATTHTDNEIQDQSLTDYMARKEEKQDKIYYVAADTFNTAKNSPHLEVFRKNDIEVLLLHDRVDEWLMNHLMEFEGVKFQDVARGSLDLGEIEDKKSEKEQKKVEEEFAGLVKRITDVMGDKIEEVRITHRLTDSPACLVVGEDDMGMQMRRILESSGQQMPESKRIFEVNPTHPLVEKMHDETDEDRFKDLSLILYDQASLAEGGQLDDPAGYVQRMNSLLLELSG